jgi:hypothetical protein
MRKIKKHMKYKRYLIPVCHAASLTIQLPFPTGCDKQLKSVCITCPMATFQEIKMPIGEKVRRLC